MQRIANDPVTTTTIIYMICYFIGGLILVGCTDGRDHKSSSKGDRPSEKELSEDSDFDSQTDSSVVVAEKTPTDSSGKEAGTSIIFATHIGNPPTSLASIDIPPLESGLIVTSIEMNVSSIEMLAKRSTGIEVERDLGPSRWPGPYIVELVRRSAEPKISDVNVLDGTYYRLEFGIKKTDKLSLPGYEEDISVLVRGKIDLGGETPVAVALKKSLDFRIQGDKGVRLFADQKIPIQVSFDLNAWFSGIDFEALDRQNEEILITSDHNDKSYKAIIKNIAASATFGVDRDGDGRVRGDEVGGASVKKSDKGDEDEAGDKDGGEDD